VKTGFEVVRMEDRHRAAYRAMINGWPALPIQAGLEHHDFLRRILPHAEGRYLIAVSADDKIVGALPSFLTRPSGHPAVINALPFFGGHGGPYVANGTPEPDAIKTALLKAFLGLATTEKAAAATLVTSPLDSDPGWFAQVLGSTSRDWRIGQVSMLPQCTGEPELVGDLLMAGFHQKTRNAVRKGLKGGYRFRGGGSEDDFEALHTLHSINMAAIGAPAKSAEVFAELRAAFPVGTGSRLYLAEADGDIVAALLVLLCNGIVEYFTPAVAESHRSGQPLSALIFIAMQDAVKSGCRVWNWGGTHPSLTDLHRFKERWGAADHPYHYFTTIRSPDILRVPRERLQELYPYFFVVPYAMLEEP
jgi:Acetyltransferase (GNAT) domain